MQVSFTGSLACHVLILFISNVKEDHTVRVCMCACPDLCLMSPHPGGGGVGMARNLVSLVGSKFEADT